MAPHIPSDRRSTPESKFYLPALVTPEDSANPFERVWAALFNHRVGPSS